MKPSKMHHMGIPIEFTEYQEATSEHYIPTNAPELSNEANTHELPSGSYNIPKTPQKFDPSIQEATAKGKAECRQTTSDTQCVQVCQMGQYTLLIIP